VPVTLELATYRSLSNMAKVDRRAWTSSSLLSLSQRRLSGHTSADDTDTQQGRPRPCFLVVLYFPSFFSRLTRLAGLACRGPRGADCSLYTTRTVCTSLARMPWHLSGPHTTAPTPLPPPAPTKDEHGRKGTQPRSLEYGTSALLSSQSQLRRCSPARQHPWHPRCTTRSSPPRRTCRLPSRTHRRQCRE
jgi:hypothetical protein